MAIDHRRMAYDVILLGGDDESRVFKHYPAIESSRRPARLAGRNRP